MSYLSDKRSRRNKLRKTANELHKELVKRGIMKPELEGPFSSRLMPNRFAKEAETERKRLEKQNRRALGKFFPGRLC